MKSETITQTEYLVRIIVPRTTHKMRVRHGRQFTPAIRDAFHAAIKRAARKALQEYIRAGRLDRCFRVEV
jgi:hypothetical protein